MSTAEELPGFDDKGDLVGMLGVLYNDMDGQPVFYFETSVGFVSRVRR